VQSAPPKVCPPPKVVAFYKPAGKKATKIRPAPSHPTATGFWRRSRDIIQWAAPTLIALTALVLTIHWHSVNASATDDQVEALVRQRLEPINQRLDHLNEQVNDLLRQLTRIDQEIQSREAAKSSSQSHFRPSGLELRHPPTHRAGNRPAIPRN
jgi:hypothetical protein